MNRAALALATLALGLAAGTASGQPNAAPATLHPGANATTPDVPSGTGRIRGRIAHAERPAAAGGLTVVLYSLSPSGSPGLRTSLSDEDGSFAFDGVSSDPATVYMVGTRAAGIPYGIRFAFAPGEAERSVEIPISDPDADTSRIRIESSRIRIDRGCSGLVVNESYELVNPGGRTVHVDPEALDGQPPIFSVTVPAAAHAIQLLPGSFDPGLEIDGTTLSFWGPLRPGARSLEFRYTLPAAASPLAARWRLPRNIGRVVVEAARGGVQPRAEGLRPGAPTERDGRVYATWVRERRPDGDSLDLSLEIPATQPESGGLTDSGRLTGSGRPTDSGRLTLVGVRLLMELDDAALEVDEQIEIEVAGGESLSARDEAPLLCLELPDAAQGLQFSQASLSLGLAPDPSGALAIYGPLPPGRSLLGLGYRIAVEDAAVVFERRFPRALPTLSAFVADTGLTAESDRLHRRRPVSSGSRTYLHLEGFALEPDEPVDLSLVPLQKPAAMPRLALAAIVTLAAVASLGVLAAPLRSGRPAPVTPASDPGGDSLELDGVYGVIRDLDDDLETGKITAEDHAHRRDALRAQAVSLLREAGKPAAAPVTAATCPECGRARDPGARFCASCGARVDGAG